MSINASLFSSEYDDWNTPAEVLRAIALFDAIGLDPCSNAQSIVNARVAWRLDRGQDALRLDWSGHGLVFCNPPYGDAIDAFMRKMDREGGAGVEIIALIPNRTCTAWYHDNIRRVTAKCDWRGRLQHVRGIADQAQLSLLRGSANDSIPAQGVGQSAPFPSALLYWGKRAQHFRAVFRHHGAIWTRASSRGARSLATSSGPEGLKGTGR